MNSDSEYSLYVDDDNNGNSSDTASSDGNMSISLSFRESTNAYLSGFLPNIGLLSAKSLYSLSNPLIKHQEEESTPKLSYWQAVLHGINALCGIGVLSTPSAVKEGGWASLSILFIFAILAWYTGILLCRCLDKETNLETYPDIGQAAFGSKGYFLISVIFYMECYACCVEHIILEGDNLSSLFPHAHLGFLGFELNSTHLFPLVACLTVLPTVWLRDLSVLCYISVGGVVSAVVVVVCLFWYGIVDDVTFQIEGSTSNLTGLPIAVGIFGFCYAGHIIFPNIYKSMEKPTQFPSVLLTSFVIVTVLYGGVAIMGYAMFGDLTLSQFTLNMPQNLLVSKIATWTTVVTPFSKYALAMTPISLCVEKCILSSKSSHFQSVLIRTALVLSTLVVGLTIPFFGLVMAFIGSSLSMLMTFIFPCACFLSIMRERVSQSQVVLCTLIIILGVLSSTFGTISSISKIAQSWS